MTRKKWDIIQLRFIRIIMLSDIASQFEAKLFILREQVIDLEAQRLNSNRILLYSSKEYKERSSNQGCTHAYIPLLINGESPALKRVLDILVKELGDIKTLNCLEVGVGTGVVSLHVYNMILSLLPNVRLSYTPTDLFKFPKSRVKIRTGLTSEEAVKIHGPKSNVLIIISPPPASLMDYDAVKGFEDLPSNGRPRYLLYAGEMGESDGALGMYHYMIIQSTHWKLLSRQVISESSMLFFGIKDKCKKELFLFVRK